MVTDGLPFSIIGSALKKVSRQRLLIQLRILRQLRIRHQRLSFGVVLLAELMPGLPSMLSSFSVSLPLPIS
jgi:hypothetical protein